MKKLFGIFILITSLFISACSCKIQTKKAPSVKIRFNTTSDYCGGAPPPDELLEALKRPQPLRETTIILSKKGCNESLELTTDGDGNIQTQLSEGDYELRLATRSNEWELVKDNPVFDADTKKCLNEFLNSPIHSFTFNGEEQLTVTAHLSCDPCRLAQ